MRMRSKATLLFAALLTLPVFASSLDPEPEKEQINKSFDLADGGTVDLSTIPGPVEIATTASGRVDIDILRSAPTREDLDCGSIVIDASPTRISIRTKDKCTNVRGTARVKLTVPRNADLKLDSIAGSVRVGATDGLVRLESIAGHVELTAVREAKIDSIAGGIDLALSGVGEHGIRVSSVTGGIDLGVPAAMNADLSVRSVVGRVRSDVPGLKVVEESDSDFRAVLGSGGRPIILESVVGAVRIHS